MEYNLSTVWHNMKLSIKILQETRDENNNVICTQYFAQDN